MFEYPIYFDIENKMQLALSEKVLQKITIAFFIPEILKRYAVWVAHTGVSQTNFKYPYGIWQYSHTGKIDGINTNVDLNYGYIDYPKAMKNSGLNGFKKIDEVQIVTHTVVKDDSLWNIADKYFGNGGRYPETKALNNLKSDTIHPGQILKIPQK